MKRITFYCLTLALIFHACETNELSPDDIIETQLETQMKAGINPYFEYVNTIKVGGEATAEITAFDPLTNKIFVVNPDNDELTVYDITELDAPLKLNSISDLNGSPNSVDVHSGLLAVAIEATNKQLPGHINFYETTSQNLIGSVTVGALPDMIKFSPNGKYVVSANEGEPNDDYTIDPDGSISIIKIANMEVTTLGFEAYNGRKAELEQLGLRLFGPNASVSQDIEPEYVTISQNSSIAWVTLQENNGIAKINLETKTIEGVFPLGFKDYNLVGNEIDPSDRDEQKLLSNWPVYGMYLPDAVVSVKIGGTDYLITANEGDSRDYDGFGEEERIKDLLLDPTAFPDFDHLLKNENLGRLKVTSTLGDIDGDGDYDELYSFGARSFSIWSSEGNLVYDSGNEIATRTLALTPDRFNDNDDRSDDKGAEPESVAILEKEGQKNYLFVGLERNDQVLVYDISAIQSPRFVQLISHQGDEAPEGLLVIPAKESPNGKDLLIVTHEDSGTVTIYKNKN